MELILVHFIITIIIVIIISLLLLSFAGVDAEKSTDALGVALYHRTAPMQVVLVTIISSGAKELALRHWQDLCNREDRRR